MAQETKSPEKWEIESAANTLVEAAKIRKNKKMMPKVLEELKRRVAASKAVIETES